VAKGGGSRSTAEEASSKACEPPEQLTKIEPDGRHDALIRRSPSRPLSRVPAGRWFLLGIECSDDGPKVGIEVNAHLDVSSSLHLSLRIQDGCGDGEITIAFVRRSEADGLEVTFDSLSRTA